MQPTPENRNENLVRLIWHTSLYQKILTYFFLGGVRSKSTTSLAVSVEVPTSLDSAESVDLLKKTLNFSWSNKL